MVPMLLGVPPQQRSVFVVILERHFFVGMGVRKGFWWVAAFCFPHFVFLCLLTANMGKVLKHLEEFVWSWMAATPYFCCRHFWITASQLVPLALYSGWHVLYTKGFGRFGQGQSSTLEGVFPGWAPTDERRRFGGVVASDLWWAGAKRRHWNRWKRTLWRIQFSASLWKAAGQGLRRWSTLGLQKS